MKVEIKSIAGATLYTAEIPDSTASGMHQRAALEKAASDSADLRGADLRDAYLRGADLGGAYLGGAYLGGADLRGAYLGGADLRDAYLDGAKLTDELKLVGERPILVIGPIGSRSDVFSGFVTDKGLRVRAGCFFGTPNEFKAALEVAHGGNAFSREYLVALELLQLHSKLYSASMESEVKAA